MMTRGDIVLALQAEGVQPLGTWLWYAQDWEVEQIWRGCFPPELREHHETQAKLRELERLACR